MAQEQINYPHNTNYYWLVFLGRTLCQLTEQIRPRMGNPLAFIWFISILLILCLPNVSNKYYHGTGSDQEWWVLPGRKLSHIMEHLWTKTGNPLAFCCLSLFYYYCVLIMFQKHMMYYYCFKIILSWHKRRSIILTKKSRTSECCLGKHCVISWSRYGLKWGIPWIFFCFSLFY